MSPDVLNNIIFIILFIFPGVFIEILYKEFAPSSKKEPQGYEKVVISFMYSLVVLIINLLVINFIFMKNVVTFNDFGNRFSYLWFFIKYTLLSLGVSSIFAVLFHFFKKGPLLRLKNKYLKAVNKPIETEFYSIWESIFIRENRSDACIVIEKDGNVITQGLLRECSSPDKDIKELALEKTDWIKAQFENDKNKSDEEKMFSKINAEYFDYSTGVLIKFYDNTKYVEYINSPSEESTSDNSQSE